MPGRLSSATCIVGTPGKRVIFFSAMSFAAAGRIETRMQDELGPQPQPEDHDGREPDRCGRAAGCAKEALLALVMQRLGCASSISRYCAQAAVRLAWVSIAPLGEPVVPPVYWMTASASRGSPMEWAW